MKLNDKNYPYPILIFGGDDYVDCYFNIEIVDGPKEENGNIIVDLQYDLKCHSLEELIKCGKLIVISQVCSKSTSFRKYYLFNENRLKLNIDKNLLGSRVEINTYLTSLEKIENLNIKELNKEYFLNNISFQKGDKLGFAETLTFDLQPYDALRPVASVIVIKENKGKDASYVDVDLSNDKINIYLNSDLYNEYRKLREFPALRIHLSNIIVMPAVIEALYEIKNNPSEFESDKRWVSSIKKVLKKMNIDLYTTDCSCYTIANLIFKNGIEESLKSLEKFYNIEDKE